MRALDAAGVALNPSYTGNVSGLDGWNWPLTSQLTICVASHLTPLRSRPRTLPRLGLLLDQLPFATQTDTMSASVSALVSALPVTAPHKISITISAFICRASRCTGDFGNRVTDLQPPCSKAAGSHVWNDKI